MLLSLDIVIYTLLKASGSIWMLPAVPNDILRICGRPVTNIDPPWVATSEPINKGPFVHERVEIAPRMHLEAYSRQKRRGGAQQEV